MSIFKHHKTSADRSATDRSRHKDKIKRAIREGVHHIVSDESIIGQNGKKKIKIPVRGIKEYRFVYGDNNTNKKVGSANDKDVRRGQRIGPPKKKKQGSGEGKPGNKPGEEMYEVEITLEELSHYLFDDLKLPDLEKKKMMNIVSEKFKRQGYRDQSERYGSKFIFFSSSYIFSGEDTVFLISCGRSKASHIQLQSEGFIRM